MKSPAVMPYEAFTGRGILWCHYRVQRIEFFVRRGHGTDTAWYRRASALPTGISEQLDLSPRSMPVFQGQLRNVASGTRGFQETCSTATYKRFRVEHGGLGDPVPRARTKYSRWNVAEEEKADENYEKIA